MEASAGNTTHTIEDGRVTLLILKIAKTAGGDLKRGASLVKLAAARFDQIVNAFGGNEALATGLELVPEAIRTGVFDGEDVGAHPPAIIDGSVAVGSRDSEGGGRQEVARARDVDVVLEGQADLPALLIGPRIGR